MEPDVIQRARYGDEAACQILVDEHREVVFRLAYLLMGDAHDAEDIAQETFIRALRYLDRYDPERPLRPWLLRIATNLARNRRRSLGRYWAALQRLAGQTPAPEVPTPDNRSAQAAEAQALWQAVRRLNAAEQEIITLRYFMELPISETAEALGIQPGTVKSRLHRALKRLRAVIEQEYPELVDVDHG
ncbi:MAG: RNA polymerase sigma factor [Anaerolineae bacterium]|nr:RNA polymerase sigma factor [Anaerolineae bacterium]